MFDAERTCTAGAFARITQIRFSIVIFQDKKKDKEKKDKEKDKKKSAAQLVSAHNANNSPALYMIQPCN